MTCRSTTVLCAWIVAWGASAAAAEKGFVVSARSATSAATQVDIGRLDVPLLEEAPKLDGKLDEALWKRAVRIERLFEYPGKIPQQFPAEFRVAASATHLHVGFSVRHEAGANPDLKTPKGGDEYGGSLIEVFLDPAGRGAQRYQFIANPLGLRYDSLDADKAWNGKWQSAGEVRNDGWSVEMSIPLADMGLERLDVGKTWKANFAFVAPADQHLSWTGGWGAAGSDFGPVQFVDPKNQPAGEKVAADVPPKVGQFALWLDREVYDLRDVTGVALVAVAGQGLRPDKLALRFTVRDAAGKEVVAHTLDKLPALRVDATLDIASLDPGEYSLTAELLSSGQPIGSVKREFARRKRLLLPEGHAAGEVAISVWPSRDAAGARWPISTGVPFAQGVLWSPDHVRLLDPQGREVTCQTQVRASWNRNGSIQWLGVDFIPALAAEGARYTLQYGPDVRATQQRSPLDVTVAEATISVNTGPLRFTVDRKRFRLIETAHLDLNADGKFADDEQVIQATPASAPALVDHQGTRYVAADDRQVEVVVEEQGLVKAVIRATGWYVREGSDGSRTSCELPTDRLCKFTFRLSAFAGQPFVRLAATTVITYDSNQVRLRDLALGLGIREPREAQIGLDQADAAPIVWDAARTKTGAHLVQHRWDASFDDAGAAHPRAAGWVEAAGPRATTVVAVRNFWKLFPKEIECRDGALLLHIWPAHPRPRTFGLSEELDMKNIYKLWYAHQGPELDFRFPNAYSMALDDELKRSPAAFGAYYEAMDFSNAQGLSVHNDLVIGFRPNGKGAAAEGADHAPRVSGPVLGHLADEDPHAFADPAYVCATGVFGPLLHADQERFGGIESMLRDGFGALATRSLASDEYGMFIFGGEHTYWTYGATPPHAGIHRVWINGHYQIGRAAVMQYVRSGDPFYLRWARNFTANLRDVGMVHYVSDERHFRYHTLGAMYHCKGFAPWAGDSHAAAHLISTDWLAYDYYLTGNARSRDAYLEWIEGIKQASPGGYGTREGITPLAEMVEAYRFTWDAELIELMARFAKAVFEGEPLGKQHWWDYHPLLLSRWHGLTGSRKAVEAYREAGVPGSAERPHVDAYLALLARAEAQDAPADGLPEALKPWPARLYSESISAVRQPKIYASGHTHHVWLEYVYFCHKLPYLVKALDVLGARPERPATTAALTLPRSGVQSFVAVRESSDGEIPISAEYVQAPTGPVTVSAWRSDGRQVLSTVWKPEKQGPWKFAAAIPADGQPDDYLIRLEHAQDYDTPRWPLTGLDHEVALLPTGRSRIASGDGGARLYFVADADSPDAVQIASDSKRAMGLELIDSAGRVLATASDSRYVGDPQNIALPKGQLSFYLSDEIDVTLSTGQLRVAPRPQSLFVPRIAAPPK